MKASLLLFMMVGALLAYLSTRVLALNEGTGTTEASVEEVSSPVVPLHEVVRLEPSDADMGFGEGFGLASVGIDGDWIVVGAPYDDENVERSGASYVFRRAGPTWVQHSKLKGLPLADTMGFSLATDGDWIVAGAPSMNSFPGWPAAGLGRAYVFQRDDQGTPDDLTDDRWDARAVLNPPPSHLCCGFGSSVGLGNGVIVVGSMQGEYGAIRPAYVFRSDGAEWLRDGTVVGSDTHPSDDFGSVVATSGEIIVVGAPYDDDAGDRSGSVYVFRHHPCGWVEEAKLRANDGEPIDLFGSAVTVAGDTVVVGARGEDGPWPTTGAVYVFRHNELGWKQEYKLVASEPLPHALFGRSVAVDGDRMLSGANGSPGAYLLERVDDHWSEVYGLSGFDWSPRRAVAISGRYALVDAHVHAVGPSLALGDYANFQKCFGVERPLPSECEEFDFEPDGRIDLGDHALLLQTFRGP